MNALIDRIVKILNSEPNMMAKDLARKLGCKKSELNPVLYANPNMFSVDSDYRWSLKESVRTITFNEPWVNSYTFEKALLDGSLDVDLDSRINFTIADGCSFLLEAIARLLALCNQLQRNQKSIVINFETNSKSLSYFNRVGFFDQLDSQVEVLPERPSSSTAKTYKGNSKNIVEFGSVDPDSENRELINNLADAFVSLSSEKFQDPAFTIFSELIINVKDHSKSELKGFAALQIYKPSNRSAHIQTIVSDSGLGIIGTLRPLLSKHYPELIDHSDYELLKKVMTEGRITQHGKKSGRGLGFEASSKKALKYNAKYSVRQENFSLEFIIAGGLIKEIIESKGLTKILGTHICFDFDIDGADHSD